MKKPWAHLAFVVVKLPRDCGVRRGKRRKVRWEQVFARAGRSWTDMSVPLGSEPNTIMEMYLPFALLDFTNIFISRTNINFSIAQQFFFLNSIIGYVQLKMILQFEFRDYDIFLVESF